MLREIRMVSSRRWDTGGLGVREDHVRPCPHHPSAALGFAVLLLSLNAFEGS